jgi:WD40 repeat protein
METLRRHRKNLKTIEGPKKRLCREGAMHRKSGPTHLGIVIAALMLVVSAAGAVRAQQPPEAPPTAPILRLNTTAHTARISQIATDQQNRYAVTASDDKTARVWSLADNRLLAVLRVPVGDGNMGKLFAVAMTPDGVTVALGGWTSASGNHEIIYLFDRASGALQRRLFSPSTVNYLAFSADGGLLAAALSSNGIRVYDAARRYELLPSDKDYADSSYWADFDRQGRLVTSSEDGFIRLYAAGRYDAPVAKVEGRGGKLPFSAVFSPDRQRVAVGYRDRMAVDLLSGKDLSLIKSVDTTGVSGPDLSSTGWSADGSYLFAGGRADQGTVRRWENGGTGRHTDIKVSNDLITELLPLSNGDMLFATATAAFGIIGAQARVTTLQRPGQLDFAGKPGRLRVSDNSEIVEQQTGDPRHEPVCIENAALGY